jgi:hypothetical protein
MEYRQIVRTQIEAQLADFLATPKKQPESCSENQSLTVSQTP